MLIFLAGIIRYLTVFLKTQLLAPSDCIRTVPFTGHAVLPTFFFFFSCRKMLENASETSESSKSKIQTLKVQPFLFFSSISWYSSPPPFLEDPARGIWKFTVSNSGRKMSGWSKWRGGHPPPIKLSFLLPYTNQCDFRESREKYNSLSCKISAVIWLIRPLGMSSSNRHPTQNPPHMKLLSGERTWKSN